ncbi:MAG: N-acetyl-gamma-glutamyl-phosphate reductase [Thermaceae bacterium]
MGLLGASGYGGGELIRLLKRHPGVRLVGFSSRRHTGKPLSEVWPQLMDGRLFRPQEEVLAEAEVVLLALPNGLAMELVPSLLERGQRVIDLSGDYRLPPEVYEAWYGLPHKSPGLYRQAAYGLPELFRKEIPASRLVANPGCYVTAATLALAPLAAEGLLEEAFLAGMSGVSGAGREAEGTAFAEVNENVRPYKPGGTHRHTPEIELNLGRLKAQGRWPKTHGPREEVRLSFLPHLIPMTRGILVSAFVRLREDLPQEALEALYRDFYRDEPFVSFTSALPQTKGTLHSNRVWLSLRKDERAGIIQVFSALDNLGKGMASQAVQNLNLMLGFPEGLALEEEGVWP